MTVAVFSFSECANSARDLADALAIAHGDIDVHRFPDGESLVRVPQIAARTSLLYRSLDRPNAKIVELLLAASALRESGAGCVALVAPYLAYMRQDIAFHPGEAVSQHVIGALLARHFDWLFTIDPHLHRIRDLREVMPGTEAISLSAGSIISGAIDAGEAPVIVGPDAESRQWVETIAAPLGLDVLIGQKQRSGDRNVAITIPGIETVRGREAVLVDDVISSGQTLAEAAQCLRAAGATSVKAMATHCLASGEDLQRLKQAGIETIRSTDSIPGPTACLPVAPLLASAIRERMFDAG